ncbi:MAG TPA: DUF559 domain-containing protein [Rhizomicrobium sp.]|jgi:very-short-patch-repair endonuclease|nr:DUF559 domain-containing protein [Rhizomicrobium sp.]
MVTPTQTAKRKSLALNRTRAREMRAKPVATEKLFWSELRDRKLGGFKFKRQYLIGPYIADYVCLEKNLIVELDGPLHAQRKHYDEARDAFLREQDYRVLRFSNKEATDDFAGTLATILLALSTPSPRPSPPLKRGRGGSLDNTK